MVDLILRPSGNAEKPWKLQLRWHESLGETEYQTLTLVTRKTAGEIIRARSAFWLFGPPDDEALLQQEIEDFRRFTKQNDD